MNVRVCYNSALLFFHSAHSFLSFSLFHHSAHSVSSFRALFFVIPSILFLSFRASARNPAHRCFASLSMTRPAVPSTLFFIPRTLFRHSELSFLSFRAYFFCHSERQRGIQRMDASFFHSAHFAFSMTRHTFSVRTQCPALKTSRAQHFPRTFSFRASFRAYFFVIPFRHSELSFLSFRAYFFCHSERQRGIQRMDASLREA
jgi:hypothetical protein